MTTIQSNTLQKTTMINSSMISPSPALAQRKKTNLERFSAVQNLVNKKTVVKLELTDMEKALLMKTWGEKTQNNPHDEKSISFMLSTASFWDVVYLSLKERCPRMDLKLINQLTAALPGMIQMAIMNINDLDRMDDYLANLGRCQCRLWAAEPNQIYQLGAALIDTVVESSDRSQIEHFYEIVDVWCKLYCFFANSMIRTFHSDPVILLNYDDPFQITNIDLDRILQEHFNSSSTSTDTPLESISVEDDATLYNESGPMSVKDDKSLLTVVTHEVSLYDGGEADYDDDNDDADVYDIFKEQPVSSGKSASRPVSIKNFAQSQRKPTNNSTIKNKTKKMGLFKRMAAVKAIVD